MIRAVVVLFGVLASAAAAEAAANPVPACSADAPSTSSPFPGNTFTSRMRISNTTADLGFSPALTFFVPRAGGVTQVTPTAASVLSQSPSLRLVKTNDTGLAVAATNPLSGDSVSVPPNTAFYVLPLPLSSLSRDVGPITIDMTFAVSAQAQVGVALPITGQCLFALGADALRGNDPADAPVALQTPPTITPGVFRITPSVAASQVIGPSFARSMTFDLDMATGIEGAEVHVTQAIDPCIQPTGVSVLFGPAFIDASVWTSSDRGGVIDIDFPAMLGAAGTDARVSLDYYIPDTCADMSEVVPLDDAAAGPRTIVNTMSFADFLYTGAASGTQVGGNVTRNLGAYAFLLDTTLSNLGPGPNYVPGEVTEVTVNARVSDYFSFSASDVVSTLPRGLAFCPGGADACGAATPAPSLTVQSSVSNPAFTASRPSDAAPTTVSFPSLDAISGPKGVTGQAWTLRYRAVVEQYYDPMAQSALVLGGDQMSISATLHVTHAVSPNNTASRSDTELLQIASPQLAKSLFAVNDAAPPSPIVLKPDDRVTFRVRRTGLGSAQSQLLLTDFLPSPVFAVSELSDYSGTFAGVPSCDLVAPSTTPICKRPVGGGLTDIPDSTPLILTRDSAQNSLAFAFGAYDVGLAQRSGVDLMLTVTVRDEPAEDGIQYVNLFNGSLNANAAASSSVTRFSTGQPALRIMKGVISTSRTSGAVFDPPAGAYLPPYTSSMLAVAKVSSDVSGVDAQDVIEYALVLENRGHGPAFDVALGEAQALASLIDLEPTGTGVAGMDLRVTAGDGTTPLLFSGDPFAGISLNDPVPACAAFSGSTCTDATGDNLVVVRFKLRVKDTVLAGSVLPDDRARLVRFRSSPTGGDFVSGGLIDPDDASDGTRVSVPEIGIAIAPALSPALTVGETTTYEVTLTFPDGAASNVSLSEALPPGLLFADLLGGFASATLDGVAAGAFASAPNVTAAGTKLTWTSANVDASAGALATGTATHTVQLAVQVVLANVSAVQAGAVLTPDVSAVATYDADLSTATVNAQPPAITEPVLQLSAFSATPLGGDAGDVITFHAAYGHAPSSTSDAAYDVSFSVTLPSHFAAPSAPSVSDCPGVIVDVSGNTLTVICPQIPNDGTTLDFAFDALLASTLPLGSTSTITPSLQWTSLSGVAPDPSSEADDGERTGAGGVNDYAISAPAISFVNSYGSFTHDVLTTTSDTSAPFSARIGDLIKYRVTALVPEGSASLRFNYHLPSASLVFVRSDWVSTSVADCGGGDCSALLTGVVGSPASITQSGNDVSFDLGTVTNPNNSPGSVNGVLVFDVTARVANTLTNNAGTTLTASIDMNGGALTPSTSVTIVDPALTAASAAAAPAAPYDAGDTFSHTVTLTNGSSNASPAFDVRLTRATPATLTLTGITVSAGTCTIPAAVGGNYPATNPTLTGTSVVVLDAIAPSSACAITYSYRVTDTLSPGANITLVQPTVSYTSQPDNCVDATGVCSTSLERNGAGTTTAPNDLYVAPGSSLSLSTRSATTAATMSTGADRRVGETVTFPMTVTVPEGRFTTLVVTNRLPTGLGYVSSSTPVSDDATMTIGSVAVTGTSTQDIVWTFTNVQNCTSAGATCANGADSHVISFSVDAVVQNIDANRANTSALARDQMRIGTSGVFTQQSTSTQVNVIEPVLTVTSQPVSSQASADGGDVYTIATTFSNPTGTDTASAHDVVATFDLPSGSLPLTSPAPVLTGCNGEGGSPAVTGQTISFTFATLSVGQSCSITFSARVNDSVAPGAILTAASTSRVTWTSMPGVSASERTGGGTDYVAGTGQATNNYRRSLSASAITVPAYSASLAMSSSATSLPVGAIASYAATLGLPDSTGNVSLVATLPAGLRYVGGTLTPSKAGITCAGGACSAITPTVVGQTITWALGSVANPPDSGAASADILTVAFDAVVDNILANQLSAPSFAKVQAALNGGASFQNDPGDATKVVTVVEPVLTLSSALSPSSADAGDTVRVTATVSNPALARGSAAAELRLTNALPVHWRVASAANVAFGAGCAGATATTVSASRDSIVFDVGSLALGATCTIAYDTQLLESVPVGSSQTSLPSGLSWRSVPSSPAPAAQRTGTDGVGGALNDYALSTSFGVTSLNTPSIAKTLVSTSETALDAADELTLGETAVFRLAVRFSEGTSTHVVITDTPSPGLAIEAVSVENAATFGGSFGADPTNAALGGASGAAASFDLGTVIVLGDNDSTNDVLSLLVTVRAVESGAFPLGDEANAVALSLDAATVSPVSIPVSYVMPSPTIALTASNLTPAAGDVPLTYTVTLENAADGVQDGPLCETTVLLESPLGLSPVDPSSDGADNDADGLVDVADLDGEGTLTGHDVTFTLAGCLLPGESVVYTVAAVVANDIADAVATASATLASYHALPAGVAILPSVDHVDNDGNGSVDEAGDAQAVLDIDPRAPELLFEKVYRNITTGQTLGVDPLVVVRPLDVVEYVIDVSNNGSASSVGLSLTDTLPAMLAYLPGTEAIAAPAASASVSVGGGILSASIGDLAGAQSARILVRLRVPAQTAPNTLVANQAALISGDGYGGRVSDDPTTAAQADATQLITSGDDADADGLNDTDEVNGGTDPNDADSDDDGVLDGLEATWDQDTDGDGLIDARDPDSDNDLLFDGTELGLDCANPATNLGAHHCIPDADAGVTTTDPRDADTDDGGVRDGIEDSNHDGDIDAGETNPLLGSDDASPANRDSDGDGLSDAAEAASFTDPNDTDSDDDGVADGDEPLWSEDSDGDGRINALDPDSDNDGLRDGTELGRTAPLADTDLRRGDFVADADPLTLTNPLAADSDRGGVRDGAEDPNHNGRRDAGEANPADANDDIVPPLDGDGDGLSDDEEAFLLTDPNDADTDDDGVVDGEEPDFALDTDQDGLINVRDHDADNDQLFDGTELGLGCALPDTELGAGRCIADADNSTKTFGLIADGDRGGVRDGVEDANHDGALDRGESDPKDGADDLPGSAGGDSDFDGVRDDDEIAAGSDPNDADTDDDGLLDGDEPLWNEDSDGDGRINANDADSDGDRLLDGTERHVTVASADTDVSRAYFVPDLDPFTSTDATHVDTDRGGTRDGDEDVSLDGRVDASELDPLLRSDDTPITDADGDGLSDASERLHGTDPFDADTDDDGALDGAEPYGFRDSDGDGLINALDPDSDGDGLFDGTELGLDCGQPATSLARGVCIADADAGATTTDPLDTDSDNGGVSDGAEDASHDGAIASGETDPNDGADDVSVADDDHDGLSNAEELRFHSDPQDADTDDDGVIDGAESNWHLDTDGDGLINVLDPDSDGDGLFDGTERGLDCSLPATRASSKHCIADRDIASRTSPLLADTDRGGIADGAEDFDHDGKQAPGEGDPNDPSDDASVIDSDGDGLSDGEEALYGSDPHDADTDDDGALDGREAQWFLDSDGDGISNVRDPDSDDDGLFDGTELGAGCAHPATDPSAARCRADADAGASRTSMVLADTDYGGARDGAEDANHDGSRDGGERDPNDASDDVSIIDSDGDGLSDAEETDFGTDPLDADTDDDGWLDGSEANPFLDSDGDGLINARDPDSDGDGLFDGTEAGLLCHHPATDVSRGACIADADMGASRTFPLIADSDGGSVRDGAEDANHDGRVDSAESDPNDASDDVAGASDQDADGLSDGEELSLASDPLDDDSDDDGVADGAEPNALVDTDGDGLRNLLDADSDGDGIYDGTELSVTQPLRGTDLIFGNFLADRDPSTHTDPLDADSDHGGVSDGREDSNHDGRFDPGERDPLLTGDDAGFALLDADSDGVSDAEERARHTDPNDADTDHDGIADGDELNWSVDSDHDGAINARDADGDDDGIEDALEHARGTHPLIGDTDRGGMLDGVDPLPLDASNDASIPDADHDGLSDAVETTLGSDVNDPDSDDDGVVDGLEPNFASDTDGDGLLNVLDTDSDGDGLGDGQELEEGTSPVLADTDGGGLPDGLERAPWNPRDPSDDDVRRDSDHDTILDLTEGTGDPDGDGIPNYLDLDADGDGLSDASEAGDADLDTLPIDSDGDGLPNYLDVDSDNDGATDGADNCLLVTNASQDDRDANGIGDACEGDVDADGVADDRDNCRNEANADQADAEGDGLGDVCDPDDDNDGFLDGTGVSGGGCRQLASPDTALAVALCWLLMRRKRASLP